MGRYGEIWRRLVLHEPRLGAHRCILRPARPLHSPRLLPASPAFASGGGGEGGSIVACAPSGEGGKLQAEPSRHFAAASAAMAATAALDAVGGGLLLWPPLLASACRFEGPAISAAGRGGGLGRISGVQAGLRGGSSFSPCGASGSGAGGGGEARPPAELPRLSRRPL